MVKHLEVPRRHERTFIHWMVFGASIALNVIFLSLTVFIIIYGVQNP